MIRTFHGQLQLAGQNLVRVFNFRFGHLQAEHFRCYQVKLPNLKLNTRPKQLLGSFPLVIVLHGFTIKMFNGQAPGKCYLKTSAGIHQTYLSSFLRQGCLIMGDITVLSLTFYRLRHPVGWNFVAVAYVA